jgi:hypothetical protein
MALVSTPCRSRQVEQCLWKAVLYRPIEEFRARVKSLEALVKGAGGGGGPAAAAGGRGGGGGVSVPGSGVTGTGSVAGHWVARRTMDGAGGARCRMGTEEV